MEPTLLGTTGKWGIPEDETGVLITDFGIDYSNQEKTCLNKSGEITGLSFYQELFEIKFSGLIPKTNAFSGKIGSPLTLINAIPAHLQNSTGGMTIITGISLSMNSEDFQKIDVTAKHYPFVSSAS